MLVRGCKVRLCFLGRGVVIVVGSRMCRCVLWVPLLNVLGLCRILCCLIGGLGRKVYSGGRGRVCGLFWLRRWVRRRWNRLSRLVCLRGWVVRLVRVVFRRRRRGHVGFIWLGCRFCMFWSVCWCFDMGGLLTCSVCVVAPCRFVCWGCVWVRAVGG